MNISRFANSLIPIFLGIMLTIPEARGAEVWTHTAAACVVDEDSTAKAMSTGGRFLFRPNQIGTIYARCNVTNPKDNGEDTVWDRLEVSYNDPDANSRVRATLKAVSNVTGGTFDKLPVFDSANYPPGQRTEQVVLANGFFDFAAHSYYVEIQIDAPTLPRSRASPLSASRISETSEFGQGRSDRL